MRQTKYCTIAEAARRLEVCRKTVYNWIDDGQLEMVYLRRNYQKRITIASIEKILAEDVITFKNNHI
jgi:excisionase family DNA binding protein